MKILDEIGLQYLVSSLKNKFAYKEHVHPAATAESDGFMTREDKNKVDQLETDRMCFLGEEDVGIPNTVMTTCDYIDGGKY